MSHVADTILMCSVMEETQEVADYRELGLCPPLAALNAWLDEAGKGSLVYVSRYAGGNKALQSIVAIGAFNYLDIPRFVAYARSLQWEDPDSAQLAIKDEHDEVYKLYRLAGSASEGKS